MLNSQQLRQVARFWWVFLLVALALFARLAPTETAPIVSAQIPDSACIGAIQNNPVCTANDVTIAQINVLDIIDPCEFIGDTATVLLQTEIVTGASERYDIGLFINVDGGAADANDADSCYRDHLRPASETNLDLNLTGGSGPFYDAEIVQDPADTCGDTLQNTIVKFNLQQLTIACTEQDTQLNPANGLVDLGRCVSWDNQASAGTVGKPSCTTTAQTAPGTPSKCNCGFTEIAVQVPPVDLDIDKRIVGGLTMIKPGETFTYEIEVTHVFPLSPSTEQAVNVKVTDDIDPRLKATSFTVPDGLCAVSNTVNGINNDPGYNGDLECSLANLSPGGSAIITLQVMVDPGLAEAGPQNIPNEACVSGNGQTTNLPIGVYPDNPTDLNRICDNVDISTPVVVSYFNATPVDGGVRFDWTTSKELGNVGFNLYVETENGRVLVNEQPVLSKVIDSFGPVDYSYEAAGLAGDTFYLEDIALWGEKRLNGPYTLGEAFGEPVEPDRIDWEAINAENDALEAQRTETANQAATTAAVAATEARNSGTLGARIYDWADRMLGIQGPPGQGATVAVYPTLELSVKSDGIYRLTYEKIKADTKVDLAGVSGSALALTDRFGAVPIYVSASTFGAGAYIEFYGKGLDTLYTDTNVYRLEVNSANASRVQEAKASVPRRAVFPASYLETSLVENNTAYSVWSPTSDPWVAKSILANMNSPVSFTFDLPVDNYTGGPATVAVNLWGYPDGTPNAKHHATVAVNDAQVADSLFEGSAAHTITAQLPGGIAASDNTLSVTIPADRGSYDQVALESYSVTYPRAFVATGNQLDFTAAGEAFKVSGLNSSQVVAYRVTGGRPARLQGISVAGSGSNYQASFAGSVEAATYYVSTAAALPAPGVAVATAREDINSGTADLLIISHPNFISGFQPLADVRTGQGYSVKLVDVNQVYANYSGGVYDAQAIRDYVRHAILNMGVEYIILGGGDTLNYRAYPWDSPWGSQLGRSISFIPSLYGPNIQGIQYAPMDPLFTDVNGDRVPDAAIGRFPVRTTAELQRMIDKTLAYGDGIGNNYTALLAAGSGFQGDSNAFGNALGDDWAITRAHVSDGGNAAARTALFNAISTGPRLLSFVGHSNEYYWGTNPRLFSSFADTGSLTNTEPMVVTQWGCSNSNYTDPTFNTLAHAFLLAGPGNNGAAVVAGSTSLAMAGSEREFGKLLAPYMTQPGMTMGSAMLRAKSDLAVRHPEMVDVLLGWTILGDPTVVLQP